MNISSVNAFHAPYLFQITLCMYVCMVPTSIPYHPPLSFSQRFNKEGALIQPHLIHIDQFNCSAATINMFVCFNYLHHHCYERQNTKVLNPQKPKVSYPTFPLNSSAIMIALQQSWVGGRGSSRVLTGHYFPVLSEGTHTRVTVTKATPGKVS